MFCNVRELRKSVFFFSIWYIVRVWGCESLCIRAISQPKLHFHPTRYVNIVCKGCYERGNIHRSIIYVVSLLCYTERHGVVRVCAVQQAALFSISPIRRLGYWRELLGNEFSYSDRCLATTARPLQRCARI